VLERFYFLTCDDNPLADNDPQIYTKLTQDGKDLINNKQITVLLAMYGSGYTPYVAKAGEDLGRIVLGPGLSYSPLSFLSHSNTHTPLKQGSDSLTQLHTLNPVALTLNLLRAHSLWATNSGTVKPPDTKQRLSQHTKHQVQPQRVSLCVQQRAEVRPSVRRPPLDARVPIRAASSISSVPSRLRAATSGTSL
jgi:hypothetical protein